MLNKSQKLYSDNTNHFAILANFTRSLDKSHTENNRIHLISSICLIKYDEMVLLNKFLEQDLFGDNLFVFIVAPKSNDIPTSKAVRKGNLTIIYLTIYEFLSNLGLTDKSDPLFEKVFGKSNLSHKNFDVISQKSIFIFQNQMWSNILLNFKINNVDLSGGTTPKRHILQTVNYQLVLQLLKIYGDSNIIKKMIYNSFKDPILSSSVPLNYYQNFLNNKNKIHNLKVKDIYKIPSIIKHPLIYNETELIKQNYLTYEDIIQTNLKEAIHMLIQNITNSIKKELDNYNKTYNLYHSELNSLEIQVSQIENIDSIKTKYMSNKAKKLFKEEKKKIKASDFTKELANLKNKISVLENKIDNINKKIISKQSELTQFTQNIKEYTLLELNNLQKKYI